MRGDGDPLRERRGDPHTELRHRRQRSGQRGPERTDHEHDRYRRSDQDVGRDGPHRNGSAEPGDQRHGRQMGHHRHDQHRRPPDRHMSLLQDGRPARRQHHDRRRRRDRQREARLDRQLRIDHQQHQHGRRQRRQRRSCAARPQRDQRDRTHHHRPQHRRFGAHHDHEHESAGTAPATAAIRGPARRNGSSNRPIRTATCDPDTASRWVRPVIFASWVSAGLIPRSIAQHHAGQQAGRRAAGRCRHGDEPLPELTGVPAATRPAPRSPPERTPRSPSLSASGPRPSQREPPGTVDRAAPAAAR